MLQSADIATSAKTRLGVVDERLAALGVWRQLAGAGLLEALDDRRLAGAIGADDERQRPVELNHVLVVWREAAHALDQELRGAVWRVACSSGNTAPLPARKAAACEAAQRALRAAHSAIGAPAPVPPQRHSGRLVRSPCAPHLLHGAHGAEGPRAGRFSAAGRTAEPPRLGSKQLKMLASSYTVGPRCWGRRPRSQQLSRGGRRSGRPQNPVARPPVNAGQVPQSLCARQRPAAGKRRRRGRAFLVRVPRVLCSSRSALSPPERCRHLPPLPPPPGCALMPWCLCFTRRGRTGSSHATTHCHAQRPSTRAGTHATTQGQHNRSMRRAVTHLPWRHTQGLLRCATPRGAARSPFPPAPKPRVVGSKGPRRRRTLCCLAFVIRPGALRELVWGARRPRQQAVRGKASARPWAGEARAA